MNTAVKALTNAMSGYVSIHSCHDLSLTAHTSFWKTGELSDLAVCGERVLNVYSQILCPRPELFRTACHGNFKASRLNSESRP